MTTFQALLLGIIEGLTEFLPISSTGHLILAGEFLNITETAYFTTFIIAIQLGAIGAVILMYWRELLSIKKWQRLLVGFIPTAVIGFLLYSSIRALLDKPLVVAIMLITGGALIIYIEHWYSKKKETGDILNTHELSLKQAFFLGLFQTIAMIPGVSRSGSTIMGGLLMKLPRSLIAEYSFLLAVPTMLSATLYSIYKSRDIMSNDSGWTLLAVGFFAAFATALCVVKFLLHYIKRHSFVIFGVYRIFIGIIALLIVTA